MCTLSGTGHALGSTCEGRKKGLSHENQFINVGNPVSPNPVNSLDSHFNSRFGVGSPLERHRMVSSATRNYMPCIRLLIADASLAPTEEDSKSVTALRAIQIGAIASLEKFRKPLSQSGGIEHKFQRQLAANQETTWLEIALCHTVKLAVNSQALLPEAPRIDHPAGFTKRRFNQQDSDISQTPIKDAS